MRADILCEPSEENQHRYRLKREGEVVASYNEKEVVDWRVEEVPPDDKWLSTPSIA